MTDELQIETINPQPVPLIDAPKRMSDCFMWVAAIDAWDYCDGAPLAALIKNNSIPDEIVVVVADIVAGSRKQKGKAAAKLKIPADQRMLIAATIEGLFRVPESVLSHRTSPDYFDVADEKGEEYSDARARYSNTKAEINSKIANAADVSTETIENLLRALREKKRNWPDI